jgi:hypothetical protein
VLWRPLNYLTFQIIISTFINNKIKIPLSLLQAFTTYHPNVFTLALSLSEGQAGIAWEPSNDKMLFSFQKPMFFSADASDVPS